MHLRTIFIFVFFAAAIIRGDSTLVHFSWFAPDADTVTVAGSFNGWNSTANQMKKSQSGIWTLALYLPNGYYYYKIVVDNNTWVHDSNNTRKINDGGDGFNSILQAGNPPVPKRKHRALKFPAELLPKPVYQSRPEFVDFYYLALRLAWQKITHGTPENGFVDEYMDEGFSEHIYQWDTNFMTAFGIYTNGLFPAMPSLDNFYLKQRPDGYIQRVYNESDGCEAAEPTVNEPMINPPLFAWMELRYVQITGDTSRLSRVLLHLSAYFKWINGHCMTAPGSYLYYSSPLGSGMDNTPRPDKPGAYVDMTMQQALAADCLQQLFTVQGDTVSARYYKVYHANISSAVNKYCRDEKTGFYYDLNAAGGRDTVKHIGAFWAFLADIADAEMTKSLIAHLNNTAEFKRPHMVPTLAADEKMYNPNGHYWLGSVWAPTNFVVVKGLEHKGYYGLAREISLNHLQNMYAVYKNFKPDEEKIAFEERYADGYKTIWECYSPEKTEPATRWDNHFYSRQDFTGWSACGPVTLFIENILGIQQDGLHNKIVWRISEECTQGIENLLFRGNRVSFVYNPEGKNIRTTAEKPFTLVIVHAGNERIIDIPVGENVIELKQ